MQKIDVRPMGAHEWAAVVTEGQDTTSHRITVSPELLDELGIVDLDEQRLVRESVAFLLEREPGDAILREFDLADIPTFFPEYVDEVRTRLAA